MTKRNRKGLTQKEYAERVGVTQQRISALSREKKVVKFADGSIDPERTDALLGDILDISHRPGFGPTAKGGETEPGESTADASALGAAKTEKAQWDAKLARLKYEELAGKLVPVEDVNRAVAEIARLITARLQSWPTKLAPELATETDPARVNAIMDEEVRRLVDEVGVELCKLAGDSPELPAGPDLTA